MRVLSGRQPWWWAILHAGKRIENRVMHVRGRRTPPAWHRYRGPILLHASKGCTAAEYIRAVDTMIAAGVVDHESAVPHFNDLPRGGIVGRARIVDVIPAGSPASV